jgi:ABC-type multidrug transport system permease subunit
MGTGLDTEFIFGAPAEETVAESAVFFGHWIGTIPWLWLGAGIAALAVAVAALRHAAAPRWLGWVSLVLGGLATLFGLSPLQYMAGFVGPVWLVVAGLGFAFGDRASRARVTA